MRLKKGIAALIISIIIFALSINCFAVTSKEESENKTVKNEVSNSVKNEVTNEVQNEVKNETVKNETTTKTESSETKTETKAKTETKTEAETKSSKVKLYNEDVVNADTDLLEYKNVTVNGNMFLAGGKKVVFENAKVDGDIVVFAENVEIIDSMINGSIFACSQQFTVTESQLKTIYACGETIEFDEGTVVSRELKAVGKTVVINAEVGRDAFVLAETAEFGDDAVVSGTAVVRSTEKKISDDASIEELDYEEVQFNTNEVIHFEYERNITTYLIEKGTEIAIILLIAIFVLCGLPKFTEVNSHLRLRDFFKAFFTGLLEFIVIIAIVLGLLITVYGAGYALALLSLLITFVALGKVIFIISFAIRITCGPERVSKVKAFFATVLVALVLALIEMISLAGTAGIIIDVVIGIILAFTGFGSLFRVIFTTKKQLAKLAYKKSGRYVSNEVPVAAPVATTTTEPVKQPEPEEPFQEPVTNEPEAGVATELNNEIKAEVKEEVEELKEEREEEKKQDMSDSKTEEPAKVSDEVKDEPKEENKDDNEEDAKKEDENKK